MAPLHTPEWAAVEDAYPRQKARAGRWLVTAYVLGRIRYFGEMQMESSGVDGEFNTRATLHSATDGSTVVPPPAAARDVWGLRLARGFSRSGNVTSSAPNDLSNDAQEVMTRRA